MEVRHPSEASSMQCPMYVKSGNRWPCGIHFANEPQVLNDRNVISTPLTTSGSSIDYATRMAKILARRMKQPVYVGCSMNFAGTTAEEEMEGLTVAVDKIMQNWNERTA